MFTGLIERTGTVASLQPTSAGLRLGIDAPAPPHHHPHHPATGDSISINGCCLTVANDPAHHSTGHPGRLVFDVVPETLAKTVLGHLKPGTHVNLEHAVTPATLLGGHIVQGHVDGVAQVTAVTTTPEYRIRLTPPADLMEFLTPKGSVCLDGVSLTIAALDPHAGWFEVALIPTTLDKTTLRSLRQGSRCNIECDVLAKTIIHWLKNYKQ